MNVPYVSMSLRYVAIASDPLSGAPSGPVRWFTVIQQVFVLMFRSVLNNYHLANIAMENPL